MFRSSSCTFLFWIILLFSQLVYSQTSYILFDKSKLSGSTVKGIPFNNAYIDIKPKKKGEFLDLTIYNFKFSHGYQTRYLDNKQVFQHWQKSLKDLQKKNNRHNKGGTIWNSKCCNKRKKTWMLII